MSKVTKLVVALLTLGPLAAGAQTYPAKSIRMIVPFAPGGGVDFMARLLGQKLAEPLGQQIIIDNRPGAGGTVGVEIGAKSAADGYTLTMISSSYPVSPSLYKLSFDPIADITPVILVAKTPFMVVVNPSLPVKTLKELIALAKSRPGQVTFGSSGAGIKMNHIPYKGVGPAVVDAMAGQIALLFGSVPATLPHVKSGRLRGIAVTSAQRAAADLSIPTIAETVPGYEVLDWDALIGPKGIPPEVVARINVEVKKIITQKDVEERLLQDGLSGGGGTPAQLLEMIRTEMEMWRKVIADAGIKIN